MMKPEVLVLSKKLLNYLRTQPVNKVWEPANLPIDSIVDSHGPSGPSAMVQFLGDEGDKNACSVDDFMRTNGIKHEDLG